MDIRLCCVHLIDSVHCCSSTTFLAAVLLVAMTMLRLALPHISVLSKVDLLSRQYKDSCPFNLDFYTECMDLNPLTRFVDRPFNPNYDHNNVDSDDESNTEVAGAEHEAPPVGPRPASSVGIRRFEEKHREMTAGLCDLLTDYGMVSFSPCSIEDGEVSNSACVCHPNMRILRSCVIVMMLFHFYCRWSGRCLKALINATVTGRHPCIVFYCISVHIYY